MAAVSVKRSIYMQISCFVNANGFFSRTNYVKKPTHSHDLTFRTFITFAFQADCLQHTEKQTYQELSFVLYPELEITKARPTRKRRKFFRV